MMLSTRYWDQIVKAAEPLKLDPVLVEAIVVKESSGNTDAFRFERLFWNRLLKPKAEWALKNPRRVASSYGLMQIMYPVALERGYPPHLPPEGLFVPEMGLEYGCRHLRFLLDWASKGWPQIDPAKRVEACLASYNGGRGGNAPGTLLRNGVYARDVLKLYAQLQRERINP